MLDERRRWLLRSPRPSVSDLAAYWSLVHASARATVLACTPEARPWLVEMSRTFTWSRWTPTFNLNRDRTIWLTACGVHAAAAFGPDVVDPYLSILGAARHPFTSFDALAGLLAIAESYALRRPRNPVRRRKDASLSSGTECPLRGAPRTMRFVQRSICSIVSALIFPNGLASGLSWDLADPCWASRAALTEDSAGSLATTALAGLAIAPVVLAHPVEALYPRQTLEDVRPDRRVGDPDFPRRGPYSRSPDHDRPH